MGNQVGKRYKCAKCGAEIIVTRGGAGTVMCCGQPMEIKKYEGSVMEQLGKRYKCESCGMEVLCTKAGEGTFVCCEKEMKLQEPKPLPSSD